MTIENSKVIDLNIKKEDRILDFSDFRKQEIKFDIAKLQESYHQIVKTKKFEDAGITHFGAISLTQIPGDPESIRGNKVRGIYWTKPNKSGEEVSRDVMIDESAYSEFIKDYENTYFKYVYDVLSCWCLSLTAIQSNLIECLITSPVCWNFSCSSDPFRPRTIDSNMLNIFNDSFLLSFKYCMLQH